MATTNPLLYTDGQQTAIRDTVTQPERAAAVTPSDTIVFPASTLYIGTSGTLAVVTAGGDAVTYTGMVGWFPVKVTRVLSTGTTAAAIVRHWNA